jgi:septal ring factor EnvC (AmiA/AmiB activator)
MNAKMMVVCLMSALIGAGCNMMPAPAAAQTPAPSRPAAAPLPTVAKIPTPAGAEEEPDSAVDKALMWAQRYAQASEQIAKLQQESRDLSAKNQALQDQINRSKQDMDSVNRELDDANSMLLDVRKELEKWKSNVLGFRQEMRDAQQSQLEAIAKVMKMLGGEMAVPTTPATPTAPVAPPVTTQPAPTETARAR